MGSTHKFLLSEKDIPRAWYNINPDLPSPPEPLLDPSTLLPATEEFLSTMFSRKAIEANGSMERWVEIPWEVREAYKLWRPTPLIRAERLEKALDTPAHLYFKYEGTSPTGSHKPNTALAQAFWAKQEGTAGLATETGAGQWGSALSFACNHFGLDCQVFMVRVSYHQKPHRQVLMRSFGATVTPSPSDQTESGRQVLTENPEHPGSLGIAVSEAVEVALRSGGRYKFAFGSALAPVIMHQTVIGQEALLQMEMAGESPDILVGCIGGGSNFGGFAFPFLRHAREHGRKVRIIAAEPLACPSITRGVYAFDYADTAGLAPLARMHTVGHDFVPPSIHAGGLRYHGMAPQVSTLYLDGQIEAVAVPQVATFAAALQLARAEGVFAAPESAHAVRVAIDEALRCKEEGVGRVIVFNVSGHGYFDLAAYDAFLTGELEDYEYPEAAVRESIERLPAVLV